MKGPVLKAGLNSTNLCAAGVALSWISCRLKVEPDGFCMTVGCALFANVGGNPIPQEHRTIE